MIFTNIDYDKWAKDNYATFASESIPYRRSMTQRLVLKANMVGNFIVLCGSKTMYDGNNFNDAKTAYDGCVAKPPI